LVQQELHPQDEGREGDGNPSQPVPDEAAPGIPEALDASGRTEPAPGWRPEDLAVTPLDTSTAFTPTEPAGADDPLHIPEFPADDEPAATDHVLEPYPIAELYETSGSDEPPTPYDATSTYDPAGTTESFIHADPALMMPAATGTATSPDMRLELDDRTTVIMQRLNVWKDELVAWFKTLASAAVYATLIVTFGFQVARVEGQSMAPTLADQDRLIVNKLAYRMGEPRRGDIVMLYYPLNPDKSFVKRVIAEEGDQVRIVDGRVYVNDVPMGDDFVPPEYRSHDDFGPTVIPEGYYFVLGDHRNNSSDSRHWGMVPKKYIIGRVQLRWWPIPTARVF
jgi:signal peptidase I